MKSFGKFALAGVSLGALTAPAFAQETAPKSVEERAVEEEVATNDIVVTGTLIRGTQAVGSQTITMDAKAIQDVRATSTNELLGSIPQITNQFNAPPEGNSRGLTAVSTIVRPNLRNFPSSNGTSGALTLIMMDDMRITPVGANASSVDPDVIPGDILQGIDIVTDGGSALYGADAVAGVMNFRTMKKFDGVRINADYGFGTNITAYREWNASITAGQSWSTGNAYIFYGHAERDPVLHGDTSWSNGVLYNAAGVPRLPGTECNVPQPTVLRYIYFPAFGVWTANPAAGAGPVSLGTGCDPVVANTYMPSLKRDNVFASITNSFSDSVDLRVTGYWAKRTLGLYNYPRGYTSASLPVTPPSGVPGTPGAPATSVVDFPQGVGFTFGPNAAYVNTPQLIRMETWGITPELTVKLGGDWSVRAGLHFGRSNDSTNFPGVNTLQAECYITGCPGVAAGQLNPLNVAAASAAVINDVTNWETAQETTHQLFAARVVADGPLFALPAGDVKVAVGAEYQNNKDATRIFTGKTGLISGLPYNTASRDVISLFGEVNVPLIASRDQNWTVLEAALSGRYDRYSDFGSTFNPNIGLTFRPGSWMKIFGHWGTSYNAPTPYDNLQIGFGRAGVNYSSVSRPVVAVGKSDNGQGTYFLVLTGTSPLAPLKPQTSEAFAIGFDATPLSGLSFGAQYYWIDLKNALAGMNPSNPATYQTNPQNYIYNNELGNIVPGTNPAQTVYDYYLSQLTNGAAIAAQIGNPSRLAILVDSRTNNDNSSTIAGFDFHLNYRFSTSFGQFAFTNNANFATKANIRVGNVTTNELGHGVPRFTLASSLAWANAGFSAKVTVNFSGEHRDSGVNNLGVEEHVDPFVVTNLNLGYEFGESAGWLEGSSVRLIVNNLFDVEPTYVRRQNNNTFSFYNFSLGRVIKLGFTARFGGGRREGALPPPLPMAPPPPAPVEVAPPPLAPEPVAPPPPPAPRPGERG